MVARVVAGSLAGSVEVQVEVRVESPVEKDLLAGSVESLVEVRVESPVEKDLLAGLVLYPVDGGEYVCMCLCYTQRLLSLTYVKHLRNVCLVLRKIIGLSKENPSAASYAAGGIGVCE